MLRLTVRSLGRYSAQIQFDLIRPAARTGFAGRKLAVCDDNPRAVEPHKLAVELEETAVHNGTGKVAVVPS